MKHLLTAGFVLVFCTGSLHGGTGFAVYGTLRNDTAVGRTNSNWIWSNTLETRLNLQHRASVWKAYIDARIYCNSGAVLSATNRTVFVLNRSFVRFLPRFGHITVGKTYINYGNAGVFNPFEFHKGLDMDDISYEKEGIAAAELYLGLGEFSGWKVYAGADGEKAAAGTELTVQPGKFRIGAAAHRKGPDNNLAGIFFKGDALLGIHGAGAVHYSDNLTRPWIEANAGADYSFGKLLLSVEWYYNRRGTTGSTAVLSDPARDGYLSSRSYGYASARIPFNEFWSCSWYAFWNLEDRSRIHSIQCSWIPARAVSLTLIVSLLPLGGTREFSKDHYGSWSTLLRMECRI